MGEPLKQTNIRLFKTDVDDAQALADQDVSSLHAVLRQAVRVGLREMKRARRKKGVIR